MVSDARVKVEYFCRFFSAVSNLKPKGGIMKIGFFGVSDFVALFYFCVFVAVIAAWLIAIRLLIQSGEAKGYSMDNRKLLWFVGIFATPIVVGLYVISLPDKSSQNQRFVAPSMSSESVSMPNLGESNGAK